MSVPPTRLPQRLSIDHARTASHALRLPAEDVSVPRARRALDRWLRLRGASRDVRERAALVLSELATNAVTHTDSSWIVCGAALCPKGTVRVEVHDDDTSSRTPRRHSPTADKESGRGLHIVAALAARWGVTASSVTRGNAVWAQLPS
ncbi:MAG: ATP-binding protein [Streptomyces sp.]|uniref:ATP-binding protein n=1 Tax=Streptomyces sp. TaxID=1931 RepID=UPI003D6AC72E